MIRLLDDLYLRDQNLTDESFAGRTLDNLVCTNCTFVRCDFSKVSVRQASFGGGTEHSRYESCVFDGARLRMSTAGHATLVGCSFRDVRITGWESRAISLIDCVFSGTLRDCTISGRLPDDYRSYLGRDDNDIRGNDFSGATMAQVYFVGGVDLTAQRLPTGPDYFLVPDAPAEVAAVHAEIEAWPADERRRAGYFLGAFDRLVAGGQRQVFGRRVDYASGFGEIGERLLDRLAAGPRR